MLILVFVHLHVCEMRKQLIDHSNDNIHLNKALLKNHIKVWCVKVWLMLQLVPVVSEKKVHVYTHWCWTILRCKY